MVDSFRAGNRGQLPIILGFAQYNRLGCIVVDGDKNCVVRWQAPDLPLDPLALLVVWKRKMAEKKRRFGPLAQSLCICVGILMVGVIGVDIILSPRIELRDRICETGIGTDIGELKKQFGSPTHTVGPDVQWGWEIEHRGGPDGTSSVSVYFTGAGGDGCAVFLDSDGKVISTKKFAS
jgi:hypothetical protein